MTDIMLEKLFLSASTLLDDASSVCAVIRRLRALPCLSPDALALVMELQGQAAVLRSTVTTLKTTAFSARPLLGAVSVVGVEDVEGESVGDVPLMMLRAKAPRDWKMAAANDMD